MNAVPCRQFKGISTPDIHLRDEVYVDALSVELCLYCTEEDCHGARAAHTSSYYGPPRCPYEAAVMGRRGKTTRTVMLPGPDPEGVMRTWKCEVGIWQTDE